MTTNAQRIDTDDIAELQARFNHLVQAHEAIGRDIEKTRDRLAFLHAVADAEKAWAYDQECEAR